MKTTTFRLIRGFATTLTLFSALAVGSAAAGTLDEVKERGVVRIGIANEAPYGYMDLDGKVTGEAPEVARAVFKAMGIGKVEAVVVEFGSLIPGLKAGRFDVIAAGMYITPERCEQVLFSEPSYKIGEGFLVPAGNPKNLHGYEDVKSNPDIKLGVVAGAVEGGYARDVGIPDEQVVMLPDNATGMGAVKSGRVDAYGGTALTVARLAANDPTVETAQPFEDLVIDGKLIAGHGAFGFRKGDEDFRDAFNEHLAGYLGTDAWEQTVTPFGFGRHTLPEKSAAELCGG